MIISASRRTDIPAFYSDWFIERLKQGYVCVKNPINPKQISKINLNKEYVECIVFWTKNAKPMMHQLDIIEEMGYPYYFQYTINPYGEDLEKGLQNKIEIMDNFIELSQKIGKDRIVWRYDPIILTEEYTIDYHIEKFEEYCAALADYTNRVVISFVDIYKRTEKNIRGVIQSEINLETMETIAEEFGKIAEDYEIELQTCSEKISLEKYGIRHTSCIDRKMIEKMVGYEIKDKKDRNQRELCGCLPSIDIGAYDTCPYGCLYCYASTNEEKTKNNIEVHDKNSELLVGEIAEGDKVTERKIESLKEKQED